MKKLLVILSVLFSTAALRAAQDVYLVNPVSLRAGATVQAAQSGTWNNSDTIVNTTTVTFNGSAQPVNLTQTGGTAIPLDANGNYSVPTKDVSIRQAEENLYLQEYSNGIQQQIIGESETSQRMGFEIR